MKINYSDYQYFSRVLLVWWAKKKSISKFETTLWETGRCTFAHILRRWLLSLLTRQTVSCSILIFRAGIQIAAVPTWCTTFGRISNSDHTGAFFAATQQSSDTACSFTSPSTILFHWKTIEIHGGVSSSPILCTLFENLRSEWEWYVTSL